MKEAFLSNASGRVDYRTQVLTRMGSIAASEWNLLAAAGAGRERAQPFLRHEFFDAIERAGCVGEAAGWTTQHLVLRDANGTAAAIVPLYRKTHSYGEYVFDWAWADAWHRYGRRYYPKWLAAVPFTPVPGTRLAARDANARAAAAAALRALAESSGLSSLHVLFPTADEAAALRQHGLMLRRGVQFHWHNADYSGFESFLSALAQDKRKKIRAERRKVAGSGVHIVRLHGRDIGAAHWAFFTRCYEDTYAEHGSTPYLNQDFFERIGDAMPEHLILLVAERDHRPVASALLVHDDERLYGRYWGALEAIPLLHFELCYYQAIEIAIELGLRVVEGGAQGEHKLARGFTPAETWSAHWLAEPAFADAVGQFLQRENVLIDAYLDQLRERSPFRASNAESIQPPPSDFIKSTL